MLSDEEIRALPTADLRRALEDLYRRIRTEIGARQVAFLEREAARSTLTGSEAVRLAGRGRAAFDLPLADWAKVKLLLWKIRNVDARHGCVRFQPIVGVRGPAPAEYHELFGQLPAGGDL